MTVFFTSDLHLGHTNIIKYCNRPYENVEEMNQALISNWNAKVSKLDTVYILGDLAFLPPRDLSDTVRKLNGIKILIEGNHDKHALKDINFRSCFMKIEKLLEIKLQDLEAPDGMQRITLCHFAMKVWNKSHHGAWHLYGHSHGSLPDDPNSLSIDVGVDARNYAPISYDEVKAIMKTKKFLPIDHHTNDRNKITSSFIKV